MEENMKKYIFVGVGGALGALLRCTINQITLPVAPTYHPLLTMLINISGSFLLGLLVVLFAKHWIVKPELRIGITTGFLGGYTTFSTLCKETILLWFGGHILFAAVYLVASVLLGLAAAWLGIRTAKLIERRHNS
jgi:CrcB protein